MVSNFVRNDNNPLIGPDMIPLPPGYKAIGVFNPGATLYENKVHLLIRVALTADTAGEEELNDSLISMSYSETSGRIEVEHFCKEDLDDYDERTFHYKGRLYLTSISVIYLAVINEDGSISISEQAVLTPQNSLEEFGIEDPRISKINETYYLTYVATSRHGHATGLVTTEDFQTFTRKGIILPANNKDAVIFPQAIDKHYYLIHRPSAEGVPAPEIWMARSSDDALTEWGDHRVLMSPEAEWEEGRIGAGAPPIDTPLGWLLFYHGATKDNHYRMGAVLLDKEQPHRIIWRNGNTESALAEPEAKYETKGFFNNVIFVTGAVVQDDTLSLFYGAADHTVCEMTCDLPTLLNRIQEDIANQTGDF